MEVAYSENGKVAEIDGTRFIRDEATGYYLSSRNIGKSKRKRLHVYVWEKHNGKVPDGYEVHHMTLDKSCNEISDLQLLSISEHRALHASMITDDRRAQMAENLIKNAIPEAVKWHKSEQGRKWHSENAKALWADKVAKPYVCDNCGKLFESRHSYSEKSNKFCSNKCKSAWRRKSGVDDIERICAECGKSFTVNKYSKTKRCEKCRH